MVIILMRHGEAEQYSDQDHTRKLTSLGVRQCENVGKWLHKTLPSLVNPYELSAGNDSAEYQSKLPRVDLVLVSPYLRTQQSVEALCKHVKVDKKETVEQITPLANVAQSADLIHAYACDNNPPKCLLVVTHMPLVTLLSSTLCSDFDGQFFDTADTFVINYDIASASGKKLAMFEGRYL